MRSFLFIAFLLVGFSAASQDADTITTIEVKIKGVTCANDLNIIGENLKELDGIVSSALVGDAKPTSKMEITYNPTLVVVDSIYARIEDSPSCDFPDQKPYKVKR